MKKYDDYDKAEAFTGEYEMLEPGGYVCRILKVAAEETNYGGLLRIAFDIEEGEHKGYYKRLFDRKKESNPDAKWSGMYYQTIKNSEDMKYFKGFMVAIENSNLGFKWDWNEKNLVGKLFGGVFGQEEYKSNNGKIKLSTKCRFVRTIEQIKKDVNIPEIKRLTNEVPSTGHDYMEENDDDLPF